MKRCTSLRGTKQSIPVFWIASGYRPRNDAQRHGFTSLRGTKQSRILNFNGLVARREPFGFQAVAFAMTRSISSVIQLQKFKML